MAKDPAPHPCAYARTHTHTGTGTADKGASFHPQSPKSASTSCAGSGRGGSLWVRVSSPGPLMMERLLLSDFSRIVLGARSRLPAPGSVWRRLCTCGGDCGLEVGRWIRLYASPPDLCLLLFFSKRVSRHPRLVENHRPASSAQQESCVCRVYDPPRELGI